MTVKLKTMQSNVPASILRVLKEAVVAAEDGTLVSVIISFQKEINLDDDLSCRHWWNRRGRYNEAIGEAVRLQNYLIREADGLNDD